MTYRLKFFFETDWRILAIGPFLELDPYSVTPGTELLGIGLNLGPWTLGLTVIRRDEVTR